MLADRRLVAVASEIAGERLFADHMLAGLHRPDDHRAVQIGRRADVDDVDFAIGDQVAEAAVRGRNLVPAGKIDDVVTPGCDGPDFDIDAIDAPVGIHVQLGNEAAAGQADPDFRHSRMPPVVAVRTALYRKGGFPHEPMGGAFGVSPMRRASPDGGEHAQPPSPNRGLKVSPKKNKIKRAA